MNPLACVFSDSFSWNLAVLSEEGGDGTIQIMLGTFRSGPTKGLKHCQVKDKILGERFVKVSGNSKNRL